MATAPRSVGGNITLTAQFETTEGVRASGNYITFRAYTLSGFTTAQPRESRPLMGDGREPSGSYLGAKTVEPRVEAPVDFRLIGHWLKLATGPAQSAVTLGARGFIRFSAQPAADSTITLNGVSWTFKSSGAAGNETNIGANVQATIDQLVSDLNGSADTDIDDATYSRRGNDLLITHDTTDNSGDAYTLAASSASNGKVSKATLYGGGLNSHEFRSGAVTLPTMTVEIDDPAFASGDQYSITRGFRIDSLAFSRERTGVPTVDINGVAIEAVSEAASVAGTPTAPTVNLFNNFQGVILIDDTVAANLTSATITYSNGLLRNETLDEDGLLGGTDPSTISISVSIGARWSDNALKTAAEAGLPVALRFGWLDKGTGTEIEIVFPVVYLPVPTTEYSGAGYTDVTYDGIGEKDATRSMTVTLINDQADYT